MPCPYRLHAIALKDVGVFDDVLINFQPIGDEEADKELAEVHLFTGPNGCGKSTLLYAIARLFSLRTTGLIDDRFKSSESTINYTFDTYNYALLNKTERKIDSNTRNRFTHVITDRGFTILHNELPGFPKYKSISDYSSRRHEIKNTPRISKESYDYCAIAYSGLRSINKTPSKFSENLKTHPLYLALSFVSNDTFSAIKKWIENCITKRAIALMSNNLEESQEHWASLQNVQHFIREISGLDVQFELETKPIDVTTPLTVTMAINGDKVPLDTLPDGLKSILSWVCDLAQRLERIPWAQPGDIFSQPIILLLDEIDIHLHPKWQRRILPATQKLLPNAQIFASTHSPFVVGSVDHAWIYELPEKGKQTEREIKGIPSNPAKSYSLILKEVFDVKEEFGEEIEQQFERFYALRDAYLKTGEGKDDLDALAETMKTTSEEVAFVVDRELRQINRLKHAS